jgi:hypothetical protein
MSEIVFSSDGKSALVSSKSALVTFDVKQPKFEQVIQKKTGSKPFVPWGDDNMFPRRVWDECNTSTIIPSILHRIALLIYGGGPIFGFIENEGEETERFIPQMQTMPEVVAMLRGINIERYCMEAAVSVVWYFNAFPSVILTGDRSKIAQIKLRKTPQCRYGWQNESTGMIDNCYINANWGNGGDETNSLILPVLDPYYYPAENLRLRTDGYEYIYPISFPDPINNYYQLTNWDSARTSGWLEFAKAIPEFKKAIMENQATIKYHIQIADWYWPWRYPNWDSLNEVERKQKRQEVLEEFNKTATNSANAGKSLLTTFSTEGGKEMPGWKIEVLKNEYKGGEYLDDSSEAASHIMNSFGVDPAIFGSGPGKNFGNSGTDKGIAFNISVIQVRAFQDLILQPLALMRDYNQLDPRLVFRMRNTLLTTESHMQKTQPKN